MYQDNLFACEVFSFLNVYQSAESRNLEVFKSYRTDDLSFKIWFRYIKASFFLSDDWNMHQISAKLSGHCISRFPGFFENENSLESVIFTEEFLLTKYRKNLNFSFDHEFLLFKLSRCL